MKWNQRWSLWPDKYDALTCQSALSLPPTTVSLFSDTISLSSILPLFSHLLLLPTRAILCYYFLTFFGIFVSLVVVAFPKVVSFLGSFFVFVFLKILN